MIVLTFTHKRLALAFSDYLRSQAIPNRVEQTAEGFAIVLEDMAQAERVRTEAEQFAVEPWHPRYRQASWQSGRPQQEPVYVREAQVSGAVLWWRRAGLVTRTVALACLLVFVALLVGGMPVFEALCFPDALSVAALQGEWWRLLTPALLHFGLLHLTFNLLWWWELGGQIERCQSPWRLLALTVVIALVSNAAQLLSYGPNFGGLSGVVYGLLGYLWLYPFADPSAPFRLNRGIVIFMLAWLALGYTGLFDALFGISISNHGHLAGLLAGGGLGLLLGLVNHRRSEAEP